MGERNTLYLWALVAQQLAKLVPSLIYIYFCYRYLKLIRQFSQRTQYQVSLINSAFLEETLLHTSFSVVIPEGKAHIC
jgi:hypothetical protein